MDKLLLPAGSVLTVEGVPVELEAGTVVLTSPGNAKCILHRQGKEDRLVKSPPSEDTVQLAYSILQLPDDIGIYGLRQEAVDVLSRALGT